MRYGTRRPKGRCRACGRTRWTEAKTCRRRTCVGYAPVWAGDQRTKLFDNLKAVPDLGELATQRVGLVTVTAPGAEVLPWDSQHCAGLGVHRCSGTLGCRVDPEAAEVWNASAPDGWRRLHRRAYQRTKQRFPRFWLPARVWELQKRGVLRVHAVVPLGSGMERAAAAFYVQELHALAARYGFGYVDRKLEGASAKAAAAYLSSYFVTGKREKAQLHESVMSPAMPRSIVHVSNRLTQHTGITMRELRFRRFVWVRYAGLMIGGGRLVLVARRAAEAEVALQRQLSPLELEDLARGLLTGVP